MEGLIAQYNSFATKAGNDIITWARPEGWVESPMAVCRSSLMVADFQIHLMCFLRYLRIGHWLTSIVRSSLLRAIWLS